MIKYSNTLGGGGSGFPILWKDEQQAEAFTPIEKYDPVLAYHYSNLGEGMSKLPNLDIPTSKYGTSCSYSKDGKYFCVTFEVEPYICIFKIKSNGIYAKLPNPAVMPSNGVRICHFSSNSKYLALGCREESSLIIYKIDSSSDIFTKLPSIPESKNRTIVALAFNNHGNFLCFSSTENSVGETYILSFDYETDAFTLNQQLNDFSGTPWHAEFSQDDQYLFLVLYDHAVVFYKVSGTTATFIEKKELSTESYVRGELGAISPNCKYFVATSIDDKSYLNVYKRDNDNFNRINTISSDFYVVGCKFSPDGEFLVILNNSSKTPKNVKVYKVNYDTDTFTFVDSVESQGIYSDAVIDFSSDSSNLAIPRDQEPGLVIYQTKAKDVITKITDFGTQPLHWMPSAKIGMSLESKPKGEQCKVNLFPPLNNLITGG